MAITNITYTDILTTDMRDADGKVLKVLKLETMEGTYESGGVIFDPAYFGLRKIDYASIQGSTSIALSGEGEPWTLVSITSLMYVDSGLIYGEEATGVLDWRMTLMTAGEAGAWEELASGSAMGFPYDSAPVIMMIGEDI